MPIIKATDPKDRQPGGPLEATIVTRDTPEDIKEAVDKLKRRFWTVWSQDTGKTYATPSD